MATDDATVAEAERDHFLGLLRKATQGGRADDASPDDSTWTLAAHHEGDVPSAPEEDAAPFISQQINDAVLPAPVSFCCPCPVVRPGTALHTPCGARLPCVSAVGQSPAVLCRLPRSDILMRLRWTSLRRSGF